MNNQPILFVSSRCENCAKIVATLKSLNKETLCRVFPIDGRKRAELPAFLTGVPTLYVPETKDVFVGNSIYGYIAKPVTARREVPVQQTASSGAAQGGAPAAGGGNFQAWSFEGKGSLTDSYSSWDTPGQGGGDQLQYSFLSGTPATPTAPEPQTKQSFDGAKQGRNEDVSSRLEQYKKVRDNEFTGVTRK